MIDSNSRFNYHNYHYFLFCQPRWFKMLTGRGDPSLAIDLIVYVEVLDRFTETKFWKFTFRPFYSWSWGQQKLMSENWFVPNRSISLWTGLLLSNSSDGSSCADAKDPDEGSGRRGEHEQASDCLVLFVEMGYFDLNRQVFPWFFLKMVREHKEASVSLVLS